MDPELDASGSDEDADDEAEATEAEDSEEAEASEDRLGLLERYLDPTNLQLRSGGEHTLPGVEIALRPVRLMPVRPRQLILT